MCPLVSALLSDMHQQRERFFPLNAFCLSVTVPYFETNSSVACYGVPKYQISYLAMPTKLQPGLLLSEFASAKTKRNFTTKRGCQPTRHATGLVHFVT